MFASASVLFAQAGSGPLGQPGPGAPPDPATLIAGLACPLIAGGVVLLIAVVSAWKIFEKAGQPGWAALIPIYNTYVLTCQIAKKDVVWFLLLLVPVVDAIVAIMIMLELARKFRKGTAFGLGLVFLPMIFFPILAFGDAKYVGTKAATDADDLNDE